MARPTVLHFFCLHLQVCQIVCLAFVFAVDHHCRQYQYSVHCLRCFLNVSKAQASLLLVGQVGKYTAFCRYVVGQKSLQLSGLMVRQGSPQLCARSECAP